MIPLIRKFIFAFFYDEKAAARWLRGGLLFVGGMAVSILAYPYVVIREWTAQEWIYRIAAAGALGFAAAITFGRHVFIKDVFRDYQPILDHEAVHIRQQAEHPIWFWVSYLLLLPLGWNPWRMRWEAEAYAVQVRAGASVDTVAGIIASATYGWCCRRDAARREVEKWSA